MLGLPSTCEDRAVGSPDDQTAGWVLHVDRATLDVAATLAEHGQIYRCPVPPGRLAEAMGPGQPCFLVRTDRNAVVGLWAIGEVVAPCLAVPAGTPALPAEVDVDPDVDRHYAEVELLPLSKAISVDKLQAIAELGTSPVTTPDRGVGPWPLTADQVRAIEALDVWIEPPSDEQRARLDALLAAEDEILPDLAIGD